MKKWFPLFLAAILIAGCVPNFEKNTEVVQEKEELKETAIIPNYQISKSYYRSIIPFEPSKTRGMVVSNLYSKYDMNEFETGLMRVAKEQFSTDNYVFQEGQYLDKKTVNSLLNRKYTKAQLKELNIKEEDNIGLNPLNDGKGSVEEQNEKNPIYLAHILEHNYLVKNDKNVSLGGVVIGLALNSVHYYQKEKYGATFQQDIPHDKLAAEGKKMAEEVLKRLRGMKEIGDVPITIALFEQKSKSTVIPGNFFAYAHANKGSSSLGDWKNVDEKYLLFPSSEAEKDHREDMAVFLRFKDDIEEYFPNYNGVIGRGFYKDDQLMDLSIEIPIQLYGEAEIIGFTQWATSLVVDHFPEYVEVEVDITSVNGAEALIVKEAGETEPFVHIY
ncbi:CamS family sex pheromone protein [Lederbergia lenta]|uniref:CamS sex pheromone cAM373 family protein n=1 Tax=Lederbergia lenta TaxID=1467 RepID=A0A2X4W3H4_LEDLE|nr:CamS family sex pheromone protein [Lederbergia lenta]MCM3110596.1 CamS family sex pheromone protein [Lederbergia lenta]MEC2325945.1 CamS family sex pheromone protein [Lederbergia lenta]SQI53472.1 CamS sex pheromone cAM373 family protein [Lederbergia lenta]